MHRLVCLAVASLISSLGFASRVLGEPADAIVVPSLGEQLRRQWTIEDIQPQPESRAYLQTRDDTVERLSLREAVGVALENNPGIDPLSSWRPRQTIRHWRHAPSSVSAPYSTSSAGTKKRCSC